jgi:hypothetical protein
MGSSRQKEIVLTSLLVYFNFLVSTPLFVFSVVLALTLSYGLRKNGLDSLELTSYLYGSKQWLEASEDAVIFGLSSTTSSFLKNIREVLTYSTNDYMVFGGDYFLQYPLFIYSALFFFFTTFISLLLMSYLGLYGTFVLNLISLSVL